MSFIVDGQALDGPAFAALHDGTARVLFRVSLHASECRSEFLSAVTLRALGGSERQASELVLAGFWGAVAGGWVGLIETPRQRAGRRNGQLGARLRAERVSSVTEASNTPYSPLVSDITRPSNEPYSPNSEGVTPVTQQVNGVAALPLPLGSPSLNQGSFSDLLQIASLLASSKDLKAKTRTRTKGEAKPTWRRVPSDWEPTAEHTKIAIAMAVDLKLEASKFRDHEFAKPKRDADATFRNWLRAAKPSGRPSGSNGARKYATPEDVNAMLGLK